MLASASCPVWIAGDREVCEVLELENDDLAYRIAHMRVTTVWQNRTNDD